MSTIESPLKGGNMLLLDSLVSATRDFVRRVVIPIDDEHDGDIEAAGGDDLRRRLQAHARDAGLLTPQGPADLGGLGLNMSERARVLEAAGYSLFGPVAINAQAPDEGNIHLLDHVATTDQRERYLRPLVAGECRSAFAMTEPAPGSGSDPAALATRQPGRRRMGDQWAQAVHHRRRRCRVLDHHGSHQWGARSQRRSDDVPRPVLRTGHHRRATRQDDRPLDVGRSLRNLPDERLRRRRRGSGRGRHRLPLRAGAARTCAHDPRNAVAGCGPACAEIAVLYASQRRAFGSRLADLGLAQQLIADNEIDLAATRALLDSACGALDAGERANKATSITKTFAAEALNRVADRAVQLCGGLGVSRDLPVVKVARELRPFRVYDGPSEVHRWSIASRAVREHGAEAVR